MYHYSYFELAGGVTGILIALIATVRRRGLFGKNKKESRVAAVGIIIFGIISVSLACLFNSWSTHRWDREYIVAFLELKVLNGYGWLFRGPAYIGYTFIIWGIIILLILGKTKDKPDRITTGSTADRD